MNFIVPLIYFILTNGLIVYISKKSFGKCLPISMMTVTFVEFFSQVLFKTFKIGDVINLVFPIIFIVLILYQKIRKKDLGEFKNNFITKGLYAFCITYICIYFFDFRRTFSTWDELSHWGVMVKEMIRLDSFYSVDLSNLMVHKDYPPIIQLFELFFVKLSGGYSESNLIISIHLITFSLFIPMLCENVNKFNKITFVIKTLCILLSMFLIVAFFDQHGIINTIYIDYVMASIVAYLFSIVIFENDTISLFNLIKVSLGCSFLVLTKQIALTLYAMVLFIFCVNIILKNKLYLKSNIKKVFNKKYILKAILILILLIIIPLLFWGGWNNYVKVLDIEQQFKLNDLKIIELPKVILKESGNDWQQEAAQNYIEAIKNRNMTTSNIQLSYFQCMALTLLLLCICYIVFNKVLSIEKILSIAITLVIGYIGYSFVMLTLYSFSFGSIEGPNLASFNRYLPTYVILCMFILLFMYIYLDNKIDPECKSVNRIIILTTILVIIQSPEIINKFNLLTDPSSFSNFREHAAIITEKVEENSKVYIIAEDSVREYQFFTKYYMDTIEVNVDHYDFPTINDGEYEVYFNTFIKEYMLKFDYVYLAKINEEFINNYDFMFKDGIIETGNIYKITTENNELKLNMLN